MTSKPKLLAGQISSFNATYPKALLELFEVYFLKTNALDRGATLAFLFCLVLFFN